MGERQSLSPWPLCQQELTHELRNTERKPQILLSSSLPFSTVGASSLLRRHCGSSIPLRAPPSLITACHRTCCCRVRTVERDTRLQPTFLAEPLSESTADLQRATTVHHRWDHRPGDHHRLRPSQSYATQRSTQDYLSSLDRDVAAMQCHISVGHWSRAQSTLDSSQKNSWAFSKLTRCPN